MTEFERPVGTLRNGDQVWPGPTYLIRIHGDPERLVDTDICDVIEDHYNVLARLETHVIQVRKLRIGWSVDGNWCPTVNIRDHAIQRIRREHVGERVVIRTPG